MILNWGKPTIEFTPLDSTGSIPAGAVWTAFPTPKDGTTQLTTEDGELTEALEEDGGVVDTKTKKSKFSFEFQTFVKKGENFPLEDVDGIVEGNYALRVTPPDLDTRGLKFLKASVRASHTYTAADGSLIKYTFKALTPNDNGKMLRYFIPSELEVTPEALSFTKDADATGMALTAVCEGTLTATVKSGDSWCTVTVAGNVATIKVSANDGDARSTEVTLVADGKRKVITVSQEAGN